MRRRIPIVALIVAALIALRVGPRLLALSTPGTAPDPAPSAPAASAPLTVLTLNVLCSLCVKEGYDHDGNHIAEQVNKKLNGLEGDKVSQRRKTTMMSGSINYMSDLKSSEKK